MISLGDAACSLAAALPVLGTAVAVCSGVAGRVRGSAASGYWWFRCLPASALVAGRRLGGGVAGKRRQRGHADTIRRDDHSVASVAADVDHDHRALTDTAGKLGERRRLEEGRELRDGPDGGDDPVPFVRGADARLVPALPVGRRIVRRRVAADGGIEDRAGRVQPPRQAGMRTAQFVEVSAQLECITQICTADAGSEDTVECAPNGGSVCAAPDEG